MFDWTLKRGKTPSPGTGPKYDHTSGKGKLPIINLCRSNKTTGSKYQQKLQKAIFQVLVLCKNVCSFEFNFIELWNLNRRKNVST